MRNLIVVIICLIIAVPAISKKGKGKKPKRGDVYYIDAKSGLSFRNKPGRKSKKIKVIPNGKKVIYLKRKSKKITIGSATGHWTKIKWQNKKGWVFGAYLSKTKPKPKSPIKPVAAEPIMLSGKYEFKDGFGFSKTYVEVWDNGSFKIFCQNSATYISGNGTWQKVGNKIRATWQYGAYDACINITREACSGEPGCDNGCIGVPKNATGISTITKNKKGEFEVINSVPHAQCESGTFDG